MPRCAHCGEPFRAAETGRPPIYCGGTCRQAAFRARKADDMTTVPTPDQLEKEYFARMAAEIEAARDGEEAREVRKRAADARAAVAGATVDEGHDMMAAELYGATRSGDLFAKWIKTGRGTTRDSVSKAALVEDSTGQVLIPADLAVDILNEASSQGFMRRLSTVRPTNRHKHQARLLGAASTGWGRLETGTTATDATVVPEDPGQEIEVHDLMSLAKVGDDELADAPANTRAAIVDAIGTAIAEAEQAAFLAGTGSGQPKGLTLAANIARVPAAQKIAVSTSNTPTAAQLATVPFLLPERFRDEAVWVMHPTSAGKVHPLVSTFEPGPNGRGLFGWPVYVSNALPDPATAGTGDASVLFVNLRAAYRIADRGRMTVKRLVQRYAEVGLVGLLATHRVGGDLVRPSAVAVYSQ